MDREGCFRTLTVTYGLGRMCQGGKGGIWETTLLLFWKGRATEGLYKGLPHHSDRILGLFSQRRSREELVSPASSLPVTLCPRIHTKT